MFGFTGSVRIAVFGLGMTTMFASCGRPESNQESEIKYKKAPKAYAGLLRKVHNSSIKLCMSTSAAALAHKADVIHAIEEWTMALDAVANRPVTHNTEFLALNDQNCDAVVNVGSYSPAMTNMGNRPVVNINYSGWFGSDTVTLHEFGHAFGLYDTYAGSGGSCQLGQPVNSVMCTAKYKTLQPDDVAGVQSAYKDIANRNFAADDDSVAVTVE